MLSVIYRRKFSYCCSATRSVFFDGHILTVAQRLYVHAGASWLGCAHICDAHRYQSSVDHINVYQWIHKLSFAIAYLEHAHYTARGIRSVVRSYPDSTEFVTWSPIQIALDWALEGQRYSALLSQNRAPTQERSFTASKPRREGPGYDSKELDYPIFKLHWTGLGKGSD